MRVEIDCLGPKSLEHAEAWPVPSSHEDRQRLPCSKGHYHCALRSAETSLRLRDTKKDFSPSGSAGM